MEPIEHDFSEVASLRLNSAQLAYERMLSNNSELREYEISWFDFLTASQSFFNVFNKASNLYPKVKEVYEPYRSFRNAKGEVLQYLHQARHSEEHLISRSSAPESSLRFNVLVAKGKELERIRMERQEMAALVKDIPINRFRVQAVVNYGVTYQLPSAHLGKSIGFDHPNHLAYLAYSTMREILAVSNDSFMGKR